MRNESSEPPKQRQQHPDRDDRERGASLVEYALLLALIAVVCIAAVTAFGTATGNSISRSGASIVTSN